MGPGDTGDCEDFALTKMQALLDAGHAVQNLQLGWGQTETGEDHAFLVIQTSNRGTLILDNRFSNVMKIENVPYRFQGYQRAGQSWAGYSTRLESVPIDYMNCNAAAFADGDAVIVEFESQSWSSPKVIGFSSSPGPCSLRGWVQSSAAWYLGLRNWIYAPTADVFNQNADMNSPKRSSAASFTDLETVFVIAGIVTGTTMTDQTEGFDVALDTWSIKTAIGYETRWVQGFLISAYGFVCGGRSVWPTADTDVNRYSVLGDAWDSKLSLTEANARMEAWQIGGYGYIVGGEGAIGTYLTAIRRYDPAANTWSNPASFSTGTYENLSFVIDDKGYLTAGITQTNIDGLDPVNNGYYSVHNFEYDSVAESIGAKTEYPSRVADKSAVGADGAGGYTDGYCFGGERHFGVTPEYVKIYNQAGDAWSNGQDIPYINAENDPPAGTAYLQWNCVEAVV